MSDKIVMGYWDCPYCSAKGIQGTSRECPNCGRPRGNETKFYMKSQNHEEIITNQEYVSEEQARRKGKGADWLCSYCGSYNSSMEEVCTGCGHVRDESDQDYFQLHTPVTPVHSPVPKKPVKTNSVPKPKHPVFLAAAVLFLLTVLFLFLPKNKTIIISEKIWNYNINIEKYQKVEESDWTLPSGAEDVTHRKEVHHYNQVLDHYETKTRTYTEKVQTGSHVEYTYSDNGDGTFTEHSHTVPDYSYETRTEEYQDPVYVNVPVMKTKYYYKIWRWKPYRDVTTSGSNSDPCFGSYTLEENERKGEERKTYTIKARIKNKKESKIYQVSEEMWKKLKTDQAIKVKIQHGEIKEIIG